MRTCRTLAIVLLCLACLCEASPALATTPAAAGAMRLAPALATTPAAAGAGLVPTLGAVAAQGATSGTSATPAASGPEAEEPVPVQLSETPPAGRRLSADRVLEIASALPRMQSLRASHPHAQPSVYLKGESHWQVSWFSKGEQELAQVIVDDPTGKVLEVWTGIQVAWTMARGYPGAFGGHVNALYIWLPLCLLFLLPFVDWRRPLKLIHLDLLALLSFSISLAFFNHGLIFESVPLVYPPLVYLLARMLWLALSGRRPPPIRLRVPLAWLAIGVLFLTGFRIALNVTDGNVVDVGYAGVIGAQRIATGAPLYGGYPKDNEHGDTYAPFNYEAYVPFQQIFGWSGTWDTLPAAHAAAVAFDLAALLLLFLVGRRMRGPTLGVALCWAWVTYPFTLFALESDSNDTLLAAMVLAALLAASSRPASKARSRLASGALAALAGLTKLAPLALAPVLAGDGLRELPRRLRLPALVLFAAGFLGAAALAMVPALAHDSLGTIYERTIAYQAGRPAPFSVWGLYGLHDFKLAVEGLAALGAVLIAFAKRRPGVATLAASCAAILISLQLGLEYWFYLYIPWFFPLAAIALLETVSDRRAALPGEPPDAASGPARSHRLSAAASS